MKTKLAPPAVSRRSFIGLLAAAAAFVLARLPRRGEEGTRTTARFWRRVPGRG
jgi:hypothetical protein